MTLAAAAVLGVGAAAQAAEPAPAGSGERSGPSELELVERPARNFERSLEVGRLSVRYRELLAQARKLDAAPARHVLDERVATDADLREGIEDLRERIAAAKRAAAAEAAPAPAPAAGVPADAEGGTVAGVSAGTLESIAACESGGDPTAVNPAGYYGKYQFDMGTWASVGGSGNPAEASEAEQDYRASLLYAQAGASPWPVCGS